MGIESIVERGQFNLDGSNTPGFQPIASATSDVMQYKNKHYSWRQHGQYLIGSIVYFFLYELGITYEKDAILAGGLITLFTSVLMVVTMMILFFNIALFMLNNKLQSFIITTFMGFGTMLFSYSGTTHYDVYATFFLFLSFYLLFQKYRLPKASSLLQVIAAGTSSGLSLFMSFKSLPIVLALIVYVILSKSKKDLLCFFGFIFIGFLPSLIFNYFVFGHFFTFPESVGLSVFKEAAPCYFSLSNVVSKLYIYFISSSTSVTFFSPIYVLGSLGLFFLPKKYFAELIFLLCSLSFTFIHLSTMNASGGCQYGPRYLLLTIPFVLIGLVGYFNKENKFLCKLESNIPVEKLLYFFGIISIIIFLPGSIIGVMYCDMSKHPFFPFISRIMTGQIPDFRFINFGFSLIFVSIALFLLQNSQLCNRIKEKLMLFDEKYGLKWVYILLIMLIATWVRIYHLDEIPLGLYTDEASIGYNAYSISQIGKDEHGQVFPLFFKAFGEYKNPVLIYFAAILIKFFGPSIYILRLTPSILGILTVFYTYKLANVYFDKMVSLLSALLLAISPWHILFSRTVLDPSSLTLFIVLGLYLFSKGLKEKSDNYIILSAIPIGISFYCYAIAKLFIPLLYISLFFIHFDEIRKRKKCLLLGA